jgi:hypothetical protein
MIVFCPKFLIFAEEILISIVSYIIKGKIQHDKTFAAATANQLNQCNIAKLKQYYRVAKKRGDEGEREGERELSIKIPCKLPGRDQLVKQ